MEGAQEIILVVFMATTSSVSSTGRQIRVDGVDGFTMDCEDRILEKYINAGFTYLYKHIARGRKPYIFGD